MSYFSFSGFLSLFYPGLVYVHRENPIDKVLNDGLSPLAFIIYEEAPENKDQKTIIGFLNQDFTVYKLKNNVTTEKNIPILVGLTDEDRQIIKDVLTSSEIYGSDEFGSEREEPAELDLSPWKKRGTEYHVYFHKGLLNRNELTFIRASVKKDLIANAIRVFLQRKEYIESVIKYLSQWDVLEKDLETFKEMSALLIANLETPDAEISKFQSTLYQERDMITETLKDICNSVEQTNSSEHTFQNTMNRENDFLKNYEHVLKILSETTFFIENLITQRNNLKTDLASIEKILNDYDNIKDKLEQYHFEMLKFIEQDSGDSGVHYNKSRREIFSEFFTIQKKLTALSKLCRERFDTSKCTRFEQYLEDLLNIMRKNLNQHVSKLNVSKDNYQRAKEERRQEVRDELNYIKNVIKQKIGELKTLSNINLTKIEDLGDSIKEDRLYNYTNCVSAIKNFKEINNIFVRRNKILEKMDKLISILCDNPSSVHKDILCSFDAESKDSLMQKYINIKKINENDSKLFNLTEVTENSEYDPNAKELGINICTLIFDKLLIWIKNWEVMGQHEKELMYITESLSRFEQ